MVPRTGAYIRLPPKQLLADECAPLLKLLGLQPRRSESFKLSTDPFLIEKLRHVVGQYLSRPENALVLCVDEKSQCQALERTQPMLPMGFGYVEGDGLFLRPLKRLIAPARLTIRARITRYRHGDNGVGRNPGDDLPISQKRHSRSPFSHDS